MIYSYLGRETLSVGVTAVGLASIPASSVGVVHYAVVRVELASVRIGFTDAPVAGNPLNPLKYPDEEFEVWGEPDLGAFLAIRETSTSAALAILYFGTKA